MAKRLAYNHRLNWYSPGRAQDATGEAVITWTLGGTLWANIVPLAASERAIVGAQEAVRSYEVTMRYNATITAATRLLWNGLTLEIAGVVHDQPGDVTTLTCNEVVA